MLMSLVGIELDTSGRGGQGTRRGDDDGADADAADGSVEDLHPPISPKGGAEALFLGDEIETQFISAAALSQQIRNNSASQARSFVSGTTTIATGDYRTCAEPEADDVGFDDDDGGGGMIEANSSDDFSLPSNFSTEIAPESSPFGKDALAHSREPFASDDLAESVYHDTRSMSAATSSSTDHPDPAEKVYETAKNVWAWGKGVFVFKPFLGLAEGVAGKVLSVAAGATLDDVDTGLKKNLGTVDEKYLNPAIEKLIAVLVGSLSKVRIVVLVRHRVLGPLCPLAQSKARTKC